MAVAVNLRLGLPPSTTALPTTCVLCHCRVGDNHHLYCKPLLRRTVNQRHDRAQNGLARYARSNSCIVHVTPKTHESLVPDLEIVFFDKSRFTDLSGIHPLAPTYREQVAGVPGHALTIRESYKTGKYRSYAESQGKDFLAFGIESFGGLGKDALKLLDLVALEGLANGSNARMTKRQFIAWLSVDWQRSNARILREWLRRSREKF